MCLLEGLDDATELASDAAETNELRWREVEPFGTISVPGRSRWRLEELIDEVEEYFELGAFITSGATVFDVGANIGVFSLAAARRCGGDVELFCFEPAPPIFEALAANAEHNELLSKARTHLFPVALGSEARREVTLSYFRELPTDSTIALDGKREDFQRFFAHHGTKLQHRAAPYVTDVVARSLGGLVARLPSGPVGRWVSDRVTGRVEFDCSLTSLSTIVSLYDVRRIDLLKIDVEGAELEVLEGIEDRHWSRIRQVVLEAHDLDGRLATIVRLLESRGFDIVRIERPDGAEDRGLSSFLLYARRVEAEYWLTTTARLVAAGLEHLMGWARAK